MQELCGILEPLFLTLATHSVITADKSLLQDAEGRMAPWAEFQYSMYADNQLHDLFLKCVIIHLQLQQACSLLTCSYSEWLSHFWDPGTPAGLHSHESPKSQWGSPGKFWGKKVHAVVSRHKCGCLLKQTGSLLELDVKRHFL